MAIEFFEYETGRSKKLHPFFVPYHFGYLAKWAHWLVERGGLGWKANEDRGRAHGDIGEYEDMLEVVNGDGWVEHEIFHKWNDN
jgi:hypothetical protein